MPRPGRDAKGERSPPAEAAAEIEVEVLDRFDPEAGDETDDEAEPSAAELAGEEADDPSLTEGAGRADPSPSTALIPRGQRSIALLDPLQAYFNEARRYPLLSREEEHELAVRYREEGDLEAARKLVTSNLRLVVKIAHEYRKAYRHLLDLIQEGNIGLMHAVKKFDPYRGVKLSSYAAWWIRAYILKFILNNWRMVKIGTTQSQRKLFFNLRKEVEKLRSMGIDSPEPKLLAERLDVPEHEVRTMQKRLAARDLSLDAPLRGEEGSATHLDFVSDPGVTPDEEVADRQLGDLVRQKIRVFGHSLDGREREIFELRTIAEEPLTLQEIGDRYGITRERARQLERRMMDRLRDYLRQELGDAVDIHLGRASD
jgi:RNA polymerase sigma-32 factor